MSLNFNVDPYYDDFDQTKNFHRVLFKPGRAVQARELTQSQSILQDQVTKFADNIFKQNSPVTGGQITTNLECYYIKLQPTYLNSSIDVTNFEGLLIKNNDGTVIARVLAVAAATGTDVAGDPPTLIISYKTGNHFQDNDVITDTVSNLAAQLQTASSTGKSSVASIAQGVFYVLGNFVQISASTIILEKYSNLPSKRIGLTITETIYDYINDSSLLDPAVGASNYQAPGADRYVIALALSSRPIQFGDDQNFVELIRVETGNISKIVDGSVYNVIDDYFAKRDYETNGDYIVDDFKLTPRTNTDDGLYTLTVGKGLAYVHGYRVENPTNVDIYSNRARSTASQNNTPVFVDYGSYFYVDTVRGGGSGTFFDVTTAQSIDLHCVSSANINLTSSSTYNSTLVGTGYIRNFVYDHNTSDADANSYVYRAFVNDIQNSTASANAIAGGTSTIQFPSQFSSFNDAYVGINIYITAGPTAGDFRTITAYNGSTKTATINQNWTTTPTTSSTFYLIFDIKDIDTLVYADKSSYPATIKSYANINATGRVNGVSTGATILENAGAPELIYNIGSPYVASLKNGSYNTQQLNRNVAFTGSTYLTQSISYADSYFGVIKHLGTAGGSLSSDVIKQNWMIVVTDKQTSSLNVGEIIPWSTKGGTITLDATSSVATLSIPRAIVGGTFVAEILEKVYVSNADNQSHLLKYKNLIKANTTGVYLTGTQVNTNTYVDDRTLTSMGQVYIKNAGLVTPGNKQSLYLSDVSSIVKIIDTKASGTDATSGMLSGQTYDVTSNYIFDNGQRDSYYDHASITLKPGAPQPKGNLLVLLNYYQHTGGDGYFSLSSYLNSTKPTTYQTIPYYTSKHGTTYGMRDSIDFRPARVNSSTSFQYKYNDAGDFRYGVFIPTDLSTFTGDYTYYLGRKDKLILSKDRSFHMIEGSSSTNPLLPAHPDGSLVIANITHNPYTGYIPTEVPSGLTSDLSIEKVKHKRYTMQDIAGLESRINNIQYYASLNLLEQKATTLQISDAYGLNRFKNGILVDDFSSYGTADTYNSDYYATINRRDRIMTAVQDIKNFPLQSLASVYGMNKADNSKILSYSISQDGHNNYYTLPYFTSNTVIQKFASRTVNVNPFSVTNKKGILALTPNVDNWVDTNYAPALLITDPSLQVYQSGSTINVLVAGDYKTIPGTEQSKSTSSSSSTTATSTAQTITDVAFIDTTTNRTTTTTVTNTFNSHLENQTNLLGAYDKLGNTYALNNGYVQDISVLPYIRPQQISAKAKGLLFNADVNYYFDGINVNNYIRRGNIVNLNYVTGTFHEGDIIGYYASGSYTPRAQVLGGHVLSTNGDGTTNVRLYVAAEPSNISGYGYTTDGASLIVRNAFFDSSGVYSTSTASGTYASSVCYSGRVLSVTQYASTTVIGLSAISSATSNFYKGTCYICAGTGEGLSATIQSYDGSTKLLTLTGVINIGVGDVYSLDTSTTSSFTTNEFGAIYGTFFIPENTFHNGQRTLRIDNKINANPGTETTWAEGVFYSEGLQSKSQNIDFGASPAGAKTTFFKTGDSKLVTSSVTTTAISVNETSSATYTPIPLPVSVPAIPVPIPRPPPPEVLNDSGGGGGDPVAQTFMLDKGNFSNGLFLSSISVFFSSKPNVTTDNSPITLSIVGTLNGYPNGTTLDHSVVTLSPYDVNTSSSPQYLDSSTSTKFTFSSPVYIQPGVLYAFILKSSSNQYNVWTALNGDYPLSSSVKNLPSDPIPSVVTPISGAPYVGGLFVSQNGQTWTADQNQSLMMILDRCVFDTTIVPSIQFVVPNKLPQRKLIDDNINYYMNANNVSTTINSITQSDVIADAFNITTTDFVPTTTGITYLYNSTLVGGTTAGTYYVNPGKYGTPMSDEIYLSDGKGERILMANSATSFSLYAQIGSGDDAVSPVISDAGLSVYTIKWNINNAELSNSVITLLSGGTGYNASCTSVTVSAPTGLNATQAYAAANIVGGIIQSVYLTSNGSGYITTPTIKITDANTTPGTGATAIITGETSQRGGNALTKYVTKKVVLDPTFDSGDLNVYLTAYRPVNTDINVYYKILNRNDTQKFDDSSWQLMTKINNSGSLYSQTRNDLYEFAFAPGTSGTDQGFVSYTSTVGSGQTYTTFSQFSIKVVLTSLDHTFTPYVTDLRAIALPPNVNTTF
jgi:hypothetical protein